MPDINVNALVAQGSLNQVNAGTSIGTDGCTFCVGMIAIMEDNSLWCAHFDCSLQGNTPEQFNTIKQDAYSVLKDALINQPIRLQACTTSKLTLSTGAIWQGIQEFYADATIDNTKEGIYADANGTIQTVGGATNIAGNAVPANVYATIPMPVGPA